MPNPNRRTGMLWERDWRALSCIRDVSCAIGPIELLFLVSNDNYGDLCENLTVKINFKSRVQSKPSPVQCLQYALFTENIIYMNATTLIHNHNDAQQLPN